MTLASWRVSDSGSETTGQMLKIITTLAATAVALLLFGVGLLYSGAINVAADQPHSALVAGMLEFARERSIAARATDIEVPDVSDASLVRSGAGSYDEMCVACHLAPGIETTALHQNLYPRPPILAHSVVDQDPARTFWTIKHGIRGTGMPAWGKSVEDEQIWGLVAFLEQLPSLSPMEYQAVVASSKPHQQGALTGPLAPGNEEPMTKKGVDAEDAPPLSDNSMRIH